MQINADKAKTSWVGWKSKSYMLNKRLLLILGIGGAVLAASGGLAWRLAGANGPKTMHPAWRAPAGGGTPPADPPDIEVDGAVLRVTGITFVATTMCVELEYAGAADIRIEEREWVFPVRAAVLTGSSCAGLKWDLRLPEVPGNPDIDPVPPRYKTKLVRGGKIKCVIAYTLGKAPPPIAGGCIASFFVGEKGYVVQGPEGVIRMAKLTMKDVPVVWK
jgi:hypothetical protein